MKEQIIERLNLEGEDNANIASMLAQQDSETLSNLVDEFCTDDISIDISGDESQKCMVMSYALASALENDQEFITAEDIENAQIEFADDLNQSEADESNAEAEAEVKVETAEQESDNDSEQEAPNLRETVYAIVENNPDAQKSEVVDEVLAMDRFSERKMGTIAVHYYNCRKEMNLPTIGQRGRPAGSSKLNELVNKLTEEPELSRAEAIEWAINNLELAETTATNYYAKAKKEMENE
jgi:hypothetical protein